jgi:hypothetical protein
MISSTLLLLAVLLMCLTKPAPQASHREPATWHTVLEGLRFVWSKPVMLGAISLDLFAVLFGGATALLPALAHDVLHMGPTGWACARRPASVPPSAPSRWPSSPSRAASVRGCWAAWPCSASARCWVPPPPSSWHWWHCS